MVIWTIFKNHHLEVGLTQNRETMALWMLTTIGLLCFYHVWGPKWIEILWNSIWLRAQLHVTSNYSWGFVMTLHDFGGVLGQLLNTFFWALTISWSRLLARVWSGPNWEYLTWVWELFGSCKGTKRLLGRDMSKYLKYLLKLKSL
jgi:hypothetical protein